MTSQIKEIFVGKSQPLILENFKIPRGVEILVLAPHPDDFDAIAVTLKQFHQCGSQINLAVVSGSSSGVEDIFMQNFPEKTKAEIREIEQTESGMFFGLNKENISFLRLQEDENGDPVNNSLNYKTIQDLILKKKPDIIFLPHGNDTNQGHIRTYEMAKKAAKTTKKTTMLFLNRDPKTKKMRNDIYIVFEDNEAEWKGELLRYHRSQHQRNLNHRGHGFDERILSVNRKIASELPGNYNYAEVFEIEEINI